VAGVVVTAEEATACVARLVAELGQEEDGFLSIDEFETIHGWHAQPEPEPEPGSVEVQPAPEPDAERTQHGEREEGAADGNDHEDAFDTKDYWEKFNADAGCYEWYGGDGLQESIVQAVVHHAKVLRPDEHTAARVMDVGTGTSPILFLLTEREHFSAVEGTDWSVRACEFMSEEVEKRGLETCLRYRQADGRYLDAVYDADSWDIILDKVKHALCTIMRALSERASFSAAQTICVETLLDLSVPPVSVHICLAQMVSTELAHWEAAGYKLIAWQSPSIPVCTQGCLDCFVSGRGHNDIALYLAQLRRLLAPPAGKLLLVPVNGAHIPTLLATGAIVRETHMTQTQRLPNAEEDSNSAGSSVAGADSGAGKGSGQQRSSRFPACNALSAADIAAFEDTAWKDHLVRQPRDDGHGGEGDETSTKTRTSAAGWEQQVFIQKVVAMEEKHLFVCALQPLENGQQPTLDCGACGKSYRSEGYPDSCVRCQSKLARWCLS
jgi:hypothetical protein